MRVATWNVDHGRASERSRVRQRFHVEAAAADVLVLTASDTSLVPPGHDVVMSETVTAAGVHDVVLTARRLRPAPVTGLTSAVAAVVTVDDDWLVLGVRLTPSARDLEAVDQTLVRLRAETPGLPVILAGSFGQTLEGHVVGSRIGRALLAGLLRRHGLTAWTAATRSARAGCASVDHVCSASSGATVQTWSSIDPVAGLVLTDQLGYVVEL